MRNSGQHPLEQRATRRAGQWHDLLGPVQKGSTSRFCSMDLEKDLARSLVGSWTRGKRTGCKLFLEVRTTETTTASLGRAVFPSANPCAPVRGKGFSSSSAGWLHCICVCTPGAWRRLLLVHQQAGDTPGTYDYDDRDVLPH
eukprot:515727-Pelagomonas_calceolata.AAC.3